LFINYHKLSFF